MEELDANSTENVQPGESSNRVNATATATPAIQTESTAAGGTPTLDQTENTAPEQIRGDDLIGLRICRYFLRGRCSKRDTCTFTHPKLCRKFMKARNDEIYGCNNNTNTMNHFHPRVCYNFEDHGSCEKADNGNCRFFHRNICRNMYRNEYLDNYWAYDSRNLEYGRGNHYPNRNSNYPPRRHYNSVPPTPHHSTTATTHHQAPAESAPPQYPPVDPARPRIPPAHPSTEPTHEPPPPTNSYEHFPVLGRRNHTRPRNVPPPPRNCLLETPVTARQGDHNPPPHQRENGRRNNVFLRKEPTETVLWDFLKESWMRQQIANQF